MPTTYPCNLTVSDWSTGGKMTGGFVSTPTLQQGDSLQVVVTGPSSSPPDNLSAYLVFTASQAAVNQTTASPFKIGNSSRPQCLLQVGPVANSPVNGSPSYSFPAQAYGGGTAGTYEVTIVCFNPDQSSVQWSEDPEFDTGN